MKNKKNVLITGANGFVGKSLYRYLRNLNYNVIGAVRNDIVSRYGQKVVSVGTIDSNTDWEKALQGIDTVVHLAARTHIMNETLKNPLSEFLEVNCQGTINLARQCISQGVSRFIFISSIGVNGFRTDEKVFSVDSKPMPHSPYAVSKFEAENSLKELVNNSSMDLVIIRPPAIYGKNAPGNFGAIAKMISKGIPLPLDGIDNKRSLIHLDNLTSFIEVCINNDKAANRLFIVSDDEDLSTTDTIELIGYVLNKSPKMFKMPKWAIRIALIFIGRKKSADSLLSNLQVDIRYAKHLLDWTPPFNPRNLINTKK